MKTKVSLIATLFFLFLSTGFSQVHSENNTEFNQKDQSLTAMHSNSEQLINLSSKERVANVVITEFPEFIGEGKYHSVNDYVYSNLEFPEEARITGRSGLVKVQFDILKNGTIGNIDFMESPDVSFNEEVIRLLGEMPNWKPAYSGETAVKSRYQLNINFSLR